MLLIAVEATFHWLDRRNLVRQTITSDPPSGLYDFGSADGYRHKANAVVRSKKVVGGREVYDVLYTTDGRRRRVVPGTQARSSASTIALFGGSYTFGEGLNDDETLAYFLTQETFDYAVRNYGVSGYGPQHALNQIQDDTLFGQNLPGDAVGIYVFIPHHVWRAIGSMRVMSPSWGLCFPYYVEDSSGALIRHQTFKRGRPWRTWFYRLAAREQILSYFGIDWPLRINDSHLRLTARITAAARDAFQERFKDGRFYVMMYPRMPGDETIVPRALDAFDEAGLLVLDFSQAIDLTAEGMQIPVDLHPSAEANRLLAERIALDLRLTQEVPRTSR